MNNDFVILVDKDDNQLGLMEKLEAHQKGVLHRAFSVLVFNNKNELLIQKRAATKYHSANLWTNTCCSHPRNNETVIEAAKRRLMEEMGFETDLTIKHKFIYKTPYENGLTEHELDYILTGHYNKNPILNLDEACEFRWIPMTQLKVEIELHPNKFTSWFKIILNEYLSHITN